MTARFLSLDAVYEAIVVVLMQEFSDAEVDGIEITEHKARFVAGHVLEHLEQLDLRITAKEDLSLMLSVLAN